MTDIDLGFPEERASAWLSNRYFPSKVGGKPAWLELESLPTKEQLKCQKCDAPRAFLCQIYAPYDDEHNFHRMIYVFVCRSEACQQANSASNLIVLRSQLPQRNAYFSEVPPNEDGEPLPEIPAKKHLCLACGCTGPLACARCKGANYCSAQHQRAHWKQHKTVCTNESSDKINKPATYASLPEIVFPEFEIVMDASEQDASDVERKKDDGDDLLEQQRIAEFEQLAATGQTGEFADVPSAELDKYAASSESVDDKHFRKFKKVVSTEPEQILRYKRNGTPLWIAAVEDTIVAQLTIPDCEHCGGKRQFEFQIMPQMLLVLKDANIDWGVLAVYTCANSCKPPAKTGYLKEYIVKQDIIGETK